MEKMQDYFILFWWWEDEEYCCKCVKCEMLVRHLSRDIKQTTRSDHIILLLETFHWLPISVRIKSKVFITAVKVLFCLLLASQIPFSSFLPLTHCFRHSCLLVCGNSPGHSCLRAFALTLLSASKVSSHRSLPVSYSYSIQLSDQMSTLRRFFPGLSTQKGFYLQL